MSGAEVVAAIGLASAIASLVHYGQQVIQRLSEFKENTRELPESFRHISHQLPLLVLTANRLHDRSKRGELDRDTEESLRPVVIGLKDEVEKLDLLLRKVLPSDTARTWEKSIKAIKSVAVQSDVDNLVSRIQSYVAAITCFEATRNSDLLQSLVDSMKHEEPPTYSSHVQETRRPLFMVGFARDEHFVGRDDIIALIEQRFNEKRRVALGGIGGVGKSRTAIEYSYKRKELYLDEHIFWVYGGSRKKFESSYQTIADALELRGRDDSKEGVQSLVRDWLEKESNGSWFMVVDNADDRSVWLPSPTLKSTEKEHSRPLVDYLPRSKHGRILITTRDSQLGDRLVEGSNKTITLDRLGPAEARALLQKKLPGDAQLSQEEADELAKALEYLPLTINQAAAYLDEIDIPAANYLALLRGGESDIPELLEESIDDPIRDRDASNSVFKTWRISYEHIQSQNRRAAELLSLMALLDRQAISKGLLRDPEESALQFQAALAKLKAFSLVEEYRDSHEYSLHRLVQLSTQRWLSSAGRLTNTQELALSVVSSQLPPAADYEHWSSIRETYLHAQTVLTYKLTSTTSLSHRANVLHILGHYAFNQGQIRSSLGPLQEAIQIRTKILGNDSEQTLESKSLCGAVLKRLDHVAESYKMQNDVYKTALRVLGTGHRLTLKSMSRMTATYDMKINPKLRLNRQTEVLSLMKKKLGPEDPTTLIEMGNMTFTLMKVGEFKAAEKLALEALTLRSRVLGAWHPDTLTAMANLAWSHDAQGHAHEAEQLYNQTIEMRKLVLGEDHPKTRQSMRVLSRHYFLRGRIKEAKQLDEEMAEIERRNSETLQPPSVSSPPKRFLTVGNIPERRRSRSTGTSPHADNETFMKSLQRARSNDRPR